MHDCIDIRIGVAAAAEEIRELLEVAEAIEVSGGLFNAVAAIEVGADGGMSSISGELADDIDVIDNALHIDEPFADAADVARLKHDDIEGDADDAVAFDDCFVLFV